MFSSSNESQKKRAMIETVNTIGAGTVITGDDV